jgi:hypothetical protein
MSRWHTTEFDMLPEGAFRPRCGRFGGMALEGGGKGGGGAPPIDPNIGIALQKQAATGDKMADFVMRSYEENQPMIAELQRLNADVIRQQMGMADTAQQRADESYSFYKNVGRPVVEQTLTESREWDSADNIQAARGRATADVQSAFSNADGQLNRNLNRMGITPNSGKMLAMNNQNSVMKATALAGASNNAAENRRMQGAQMRQQASNLAQGFPAQSLGQAGQAGQFGSSASGIGGQSLGYQMQNQGATVQGLGAVGNMYGNNASGYNQQYGTQVNAWGQGQQAAASSAAGWGSLAGTAMMMFADGGKVGGGTAGHTGKNLGGEGGKISGPGTGTSDQVTAVNRDNGQPIRLSNGEYIIPASVVKAKGVEFFDKLKEKYHTPVQGRNLGSQA